jgi:DNA-binding CsgD family transcriptional regulator
MDGPPDGVPDPVPHFTPKEFQVLRLMCDAECLLEKQMPEVLGMSLSTFKTHKERVYRKCQVPGRQQLVVKAIRWKLVECYCGGQHPDPEGPPPNGN